MTRFAGALVFTGLLAACGGGAENNAASQVQEGLQAVQEEQEQPADEPVRNAALDEQCANISQAAMDAVEEKMKDLSGELVVLAGEEQQALTCSRYKQYLRGELSSY